MRWNTTIALAAIAILDVTLTLGLAEDRITVEKDETIGTMTITVAAPEGWLDLRDVVRGLARASGLDEDAAVQGLRGKRLDLTQSRARWTVRTLSASVPDVRIRIDVDPDTREYYLRIRVALQEARSKTQLVKSLLRESLAGDLDPYAFELDAGWQDQEPNRPLVVLIHGYTAGTRSLAAFHKTLRESGWPVATFSYPNDGPLADSSQRLAKELRAFREQHPQRAVAIVAHSMGGLVARAAIEDPRSDPGNVQKLILVCTPNHGTRWADLPGGLDVWEHLPAVPKQPLPETFRESIADGLNEARSDLQPDSRFLRELNARERNPRISYSLILGTAAPCSSAEIAQWRDRVTKSLEKSRPGRVVLPRVDSFLEDFAEVEQGRGDWVVSVESGKLAGVADVVLLPITHRTFTDDGGSPLQQQLFVTVIERLE
jgi:pimeloyl-ACP methyl ester carboxylesterase